MRGRFGVGVYTEYSDGGCWRGWVRVYLTGGGHVQSCQVVEREHLFEASVSEQYAAGNVEVVKVSTLLRDVDQVIITVLQVGAVSLERA